MKKRKNVVAVIVAIIAILWGGLAVSCLSSDTAYRVGYELGSQLSYNDSSPAYHSEYSVSE